MGCVVQARPEKVLAETAMAVELVEVRPPDENVNVMLPEFVSDNPENVARPFTPLAFTEVVPSKLPALAVAVTVAVEFDTALPKASRTTTTGCCAKAAPAVAVDEGCVTIPSCAAVATVGENVGAVPPGVAEVSVPSSAAVSSLLLSTLCATSVAEAGLLKVIAVTVPNGV